MDLEIIPHAVYTWIYLLRGGGGAMQTRRLDADFTSSIAHWQPSFHVAYACTISPHFLDSSALAVP